MYLKENWQRVCYSSLLLKNQHAFLIIKVSTGCITEIENCKIAWNCTQIAFSPMYSIQVSVFKHLCFSDRSTLLIRGGWLFLCLIRALRVVCQFLLRYSDPLILQTKRFIFVTGLKTGLNHYGKSCPFEHTEMWKYSFVQDSSWSRLQAICIFSLTLTMSLTSLTVTRYIAFIIRQNSLGRNIAMRKRK